MTCTHAGPLREVMRVLSMLVANSPQEAGGAKLYDDVLHDDVLLNQVLCILFNTLDQELVTRTSSLLNCLIYYHPDLTLELLPLQIIPISLYLLSEPDKLAPTALPQIVRLLHTLSCNDEAATLIAGIDLLVN